MPRLRRNDAARPGDAAAVYRLANEGNAEALEVRLHHKLLKYEHQVLPPAVTFLWRRIVQTSAGVQTVALLRTDLSHTPSFCYDPAHVS